MNHYSDEQFTDLVGDKINNVRYFKKVLREKGLIGARQQFTDQHRDYFENILDTKRELNSTWTTAIYKVLDEIVAKGAPVAPAAVPAAAGLPTNTAAGEELLRQILQTLLRIEQRLVG